MTRSVPRIINRRGEHLSQCDICGSMYLRSSLRRGRDNLLRCPDDSSGRSDLELAEATAMRASAVAARQGAITPADGAKPHVDSNGQVASPYTGTISRRTAEDVYNNDVPTYLNPGTRNNYPGF